MPTYLDTLATLPSRSSESPWTQTVVRSTVLTRTCRTVLTLDRYCLGEVNCELRSRIRLLFLSHEHEFYGAGKLLV